MHRLETVEQLRALYGEPGRASLDKVTDRVIDAYRALIEAAPFVALATVGPEGLDCSPRGDTGAVVFVDDETTLMIPDRRGNNRVDSLVNIVRDPRVALMFLIPGSTTTLRVNGNAHISVDPDLLTRFAVDDKPPRSVIVIVVGEVYFQCARAVMRADLWNPERHVASDSLPTPGHLLKAASQVPFDAEAYDREWPERARQSLW